MDSTHSASSVTMNQPRNWQASTRETHEIDDDDEVHFAKTSDDHDDERDEDKDTSLPKRKSLTSEGSQWSWDQLDLQPRSASSELNRLGCNMHFHLSMLNNYARAVRGKLASVPWPR